MFDADADRDVEQAGQRRVSQVEINKCDASLVGHRGDGSREVARNGGLAFVAVRAHDGNAAIPRPVEFVTDAKTHVAMALDVKDRSPKVPWDYP